MDEAVTRLLSHNVSEIFQRMIQTDISGGIPADPEHTCPGGFSSMIVLTSGGGTVGYISIQVPEDIAQKMNSGMLGDEKQGTSEDLQDTVNEALNMLAVRTRNQFERGRDDLELSLPQAVTDIECSGTDTWCVPFMVDDTEFCIRICV